MWAILYRRWLRDIDFQRPLYSLRWDDEHGLCVVIETIDPDALIGQQLEPIEQTHSFGYPERCISRKDFYQWVFHCLVLQSLHEVGEFFMVKGARPFHPHKESLDKLADIVGDIRIAEFAPTVKAA
jgi:hypothetical protein